MSRLTNAIVDRLAHRVADILEEREAARMSRLATAIFDTPIPVHPWPTDAELNAQMQEALGSVTDSRKDR